MTDDRQVTSEDAAILHEKAVQASVERDVAVEAAVQAQDNEAEAMKIASEQHGKALDSEVDAIRASGREEVTREDAREQHEEALNSRADAIRASGREAVAKEDAGNQHAKAMNAEADAESMNTLRHVANIRANDEARSGDRARFLLYLIMGIILTAVVAAGIWFFTKS